MKEKLISFIGKIVMAYEPKFYLIKYNIYDEYEEDYIQAEDPYEAMKILQAEKPEAFIDAVYLQLNLFNKEEDDE